MFYKIFIILLLFLSSCSTNITKNNNINNDIIRDPFISKGFTIIYNENLFKSGFVEKKLDNRSLFIFQKNLKEDSTVKIKNLKNQKYTIAKVSVNSIYPSFYNSIITSRIAKEIDLNLDEPYIEILEIIEGTQFIAKKAKTFEEEKKVADKAPIDAITISDLSVDGQSEIIKKIKLKNKKNFKNILKIADFYYKDTAINMMDRINKETSLKKIDIIKINNTKFRVFLGPFTNLKSLQTAFNSIKIMKFENIEIIKHE